ncbi:CapA family protein [Kitasatospora atroaurantiaca]|uniref:Poly-gamma-glutamate synthesis protein (Capsule biosynthesis protein) n=1 Tax=Kitasatospora atroaurantiaca TaxID=285545 RepID=A0A561EK01_9ACTN|nr:CapA family protein [Kitasatospora atroaurantiaca]TWE15945.1 poly-gamma-glutamate synthesis protein (capsule biosynthesis protein) [Kitasatospora atroaurantiaca]
MSAPEPTTVRVALAGDTMLGRGVAEAVATAAGPRALFSEEIHEFAAAADLFVLNLECCVSARGTLWPQPGKPFFFRAPPAAAELLAQLGVHCVTLANNHALDYGFDALADTLVHLAEAGIRTVGAGPDLPTAREFAVLATAGTRVAVVGATDHPDDFAAGPDRPGVAYAELRDGVPGWLTELVRRAAAEADIVLVTPHWGPNMTSRPPPYVRAAAPVLLEAGATLIAGHSAHVFHGVADRVIFDMGDFIDDYAVDGVLRNDLGLLFLVTFRGLAPAPLRPVRLEALPLFLDYCRTEAAHGRRRQWINDRFATACAEFGTAVSVEGDRLVAEWD